MDLEEIGNNISIIENALSSNMTTIKKKDNIKKISSNLNNIRNIKECKNTLKKYFKKTENGKIEREKIIEDISESHNYEINSINIENIINEINTDKNETK